MSAPAAPNTLIDDEPTRAALRDAIAAALGSQVYDCTRVWEAWHVNTMTARDFLPVIESNDRLDDIIDAVFHVMNARAQPT